MPTVHRENGFRFFFYSNENNEPPHIHVIGKGGETKIWLRPIKVSHAYQLGPRDLREILRITNDNVILFLTKYRKWHVIRN